MEEVQSAKGAFSDSRCLDGQVGFDSHLRPQDEALVLRCACTGHLHTLGQVFQNSKHRFQHRGQPIHVFRKEIAFKIKIAMTVI